ncbi:MAG: polysaccharide biosynthesis/export family protein [Candidatus Acidiferrales bacterium]|jgi:polysaccharide export outer membrane protein
MKPSNYLTNAFRASRRNFGTLGLLLLLAGTPLAAQSPASANAQQNPPASPASAAPPAAAADSSYVIGPDDVLDISVWKEPDLSRSLPVRPDGKISLPLVSDVQAAGKTPSELAATLTTLLKAYVNDPQVTVIVTQINSRRVYVVGEVARPGAFPLLPDMTVLQALASAGGFTPFANTKKIHIVRTVNGHETQFPFDYHEVLKGSKPAENIQLLAGDEIVVP